MKVTALTYRDYAALPDDGQRYQVLDGELCVTPSPSTRHQATSLPLSSALHVHVTQHRLGRVFAAPTDVMLRDDPDIATIVQPDVLFIATDRLGIISARGIEDAPTLAVEILSPSTTDLDRRRKRELYARHGLPYYWIVDPDARAIEMYGLTRGAYELIERGSGSTVVAVEPFAGLVLTNLWD
jgi:Uma2 family endonuclease